MEPISILMHNSMTRQQQLCKTLKNFNIWLIPFMPSRADCFNITANFSLWTVFESFQFCTAFVLSLFSWKNADFHTLATTKHAGFQVHRFITKSGVKTFFTNQKYVLHKYFSNYITFLCICICTHKKPFFKYQVKIGLNYFKCISSSSSGYFLDRNRNWIRKGQNHHLVMFIKLTLRYTG